MSGLEAGRLRYDAPLRRSGLIPVLVLLVLATVLLATERLRADLVAMLVLALLMLFEILDVNQALSGFSNEATVTVAGANLAVTTITLPVAGSETYLTVTEFTVNDHAGNGDGERVSLWYTQAQSVTRFLMRGFSRAQFVRFCDHLRQGRTLDASLNAAYGLTIPDATSLDRLWRESLPS